MDAALAARLDTLEQRITALETSGRPLATGALGAVLGSARALPVLDHGRRPNFWGDIEVTELLTRLHRRVPVKRALAIVADTFGTERKPSRSALYRYWQHLDELVRSAA